MFVTHMRKCAQKLNDCPSLIVICNQLISARACKQLRRCSIAPSAGDTHWAQASISCSAHCAASVCVGICAGTCVSCNTHWGQGATYSTQEWKRKQRAKASASGGGGGKGDGKKTDDGKGGGKKAKAKAKS